MRGEKNDIYLVRYRKVKGKEGTWCANCDFDGDGQCLMPMSMVEQGRECGFGKEYYFEEVEEKGLNEKKEEDYRDIDNWYS